jgi:hypothetical protein
VCARHHRGKGGAGGAPSPAKAPAAAASTEQVEVLLPDTLEDDLVTTVPAVASEVPQFCWPMLPGQAASLPPVRAV